MFYDASFGLTFPCFHLETACGRLSAFPCRVYMDPNQSSTIDLVSSFGGS